MEVKKLNKESFFKRSFLFTKKKQSQWRKSDTGKNPNPTQTQTQTQNQGKKQKKMVVKKHRKEVINTKLKEKQVEWEKFDKMNLEELQKEAYLAKNNKTITRIQKRINRLVNPNIQDINKVLNYDTITDLPWVNDKRPEKYWKKDKGVKMNPEQEKFMETRVKELVDLNFAEEINEEDAKHILPFFTVPKDTTDFREIMDFKYFNTFVKNVSANVPGYPEIYEAQQDTKFYGKIDLTKAYQRIIIAEEIRPYLCFNFKGKCYRWSRLPFGLNIAPAVYQIFVQRLIKKQDTAINYLDDIKIWGKSERAVKQVIEEVVKSLEKNNVTINYKKSILEPVKEIEYLGYKWREGKLYNKPNKIEKGRKWLQLLKEKPTIHTITKALGELNFMSIDTDSMQGFNKLYKEIGSITDKKMLSKRMSVDKEMLTLFEKTLYEAETMEIVKYKKLHTVERASMISDEIVNRIYVDSSPYATGMFNTKDNIMIKFEFPKSIQKFTSAAAIKEQLGYIIANKVCKKTCRDKFLIVGDNQGMIKVISTGRTNFWRKECEDIQVTWVSGEDRLLQIADIISRERSNNLLRLERSKQFKIMDEKLVKKVELRIVNKKLIWEYGGHTFEINITRMLNELVPMKGIEWLRKEDGKGKTIYLRDYLAKIWETKNSGFRRANERKGTSDIRRNSKLKKTAQRAKERMTNQKLRKFKKDSKLKLNPRTNRKFRRFNKKMNDSTTNRNLRKFKKKMDQ